MLPEGWKNGKLGDLCTFKGGFGFKEIHQGHKKGDLPFIKVSDMNRAGNEVHINSSNNWISQYQKKEMRVKTFPAHSVVFAKVGAALLLNRRRILSRDTVIDNNMMAAVSKNECYYYYLFYVLSAIDFGKFVQEGAVPSINQGDLSSFKIPYPPLEEQKKIAAILSTWDRAIEGTEKLLANSQQQKKALMQQLLTAKKRLPGFSGEWRICALSDISMVQTATSKTQYICDGGERFIVDMGSIDRLGNLVCTKSTQCNDDLLSKGTLVMPKDDIGGGNIIGRTSYIDRDNLYVLGDHVYALHIRECDSKFLHFLINSYPINKHLRRRANGTAQLGLGKKDVLRQEVKIASSLSEQRAIAAVLTTADEKITAIESDLARLRQEKKALMQQLLTGKRRVQVQ